MRRIMGEGNERLTQLAFEQVARIEQASQEWHTAPTKAEKDDATATAWSAHRVLGALDPSSSPFRREVTQAIAKQAPAPVITKTGRPRTARRQRTSTTRATVTASAAGSSDSPSAGSSRSGSRPPSAEDDPAPPNRIRLAHTWHIAGISTAPAGSVISFKAVAA